MQIDPKQFVSAIIAPTGQAGEHSQQRKCASDVICLLNSQRAIEVMGQLQHAENANAVTQARNDLRAGTLETETAFKAAVETLITLGI